MPNIETDTAYHERPLPAVHAAAHEFHLVLLRWLQRVRAPRSLVAPLDRTARRAALAIFVASHSERPARHLRRAKDDMLHCLGLFSMLTDEGHFSEELGSEAQRRIDQILAGIDQLARTPHDRWLDVSLPPLASSPAKGTSSTARGELERRIQVAANVPRFFPGIQAVVRRPRKRVAAVPEEAVVTTASS